MKEFEVTSKTRLYTWFDKKKLLKTGEKACLIKSKFDMDILIETDMGWLLSCNYEAKTKSLFAIGLDHGPQMSRKELGIVSDKNFEDMPVITEGGDVKFVLLTNTKFLDKKDYTKTKSTPTKFIIENTENITGNRIVRFMVLRKYL